MSAIAELLPDPGGAPSLELAPAPSIELPPVDVVPESVRPAMELYAADPRNGSRAAFVAALDQVGNGFEHAIASRALEARAELVEACRRATELHDELVNLHAAATWLRSFPWRSSWDPEPYALHMDGHQVVIPEILGAIEDACVVHERLDAIARQRVRHDPPYAPSVRRGRPGSAALGALAETGPTLDDVAELMPGGASVSTVSRWLAGSRPYPAELPEVLEQLVGAETADRIVSLIPETRPGSD